ncbi:MAG: hypothetical protein IKS48_01720 [Eubacterium sp.]|nr:hypothetical protein [Eubacterium sp.]
MRKSLIISILMVLVLVSGYSFTSNAMTPRVMMIDFSIDKKEIYPGDTFTVRFKLRNTSKYRIMNLKCVVSPSDGEFIPVDSVGTEYIEEIYGESEEELSFKLECAKTLTEKTYSIKVMTEYEDWDGSYKAEDTIYVPVTLKSEVLISDTYVAEEEIRLGDNIEVVSTINNVGAADIYKVSAQVTGHNIADSTSYIGNIKSGKSANADIITKAIKHDDPRDNTQYDNDVIITYEDINGKKYTEKVGLGNIVVLEQDYSDVIKVKEDTSRHLTAVNKLEIVIAIIVILIAAFVIKRRMKRKKLEREF